MPRIPRTPGRRSHLSRRRPDGVRPAASRDEWIEIPPPTRDEMFQRMNEALDAATAFMQALRLMGIGMRELGREEGEAVRAIADATHARLHIVCDTWLDYIQAARR